MYRVTTDEQVQQQFNALPPAALNAYLELRATLELTPWNGAPLHPASPKGVLTFPFGNHAEGLVYYLVLEDQRRVDVLDVQWVG
ncbi:MAG: type II toxin-antitoxin system RelE/ParE family toxin [Sciscionella sp.]